MNETILMKRIGNAGADRIACDCHGVYVNFLWELTGAYRSGEALYLCRTGVDDLKQRLRTLRKQYTRKSA